MHLVMLTEKLHRCFWDHERTVKLGYPMLKSMSGQQPRNQWAALSTEERYGSRIRVTHTK